MRRSASSVLKSNASRRSSPLLSSGCTVVRCRVIFFSSSFIARWARAKRANGRENIKEFCFYHTFHILTAL